MSKMKRNPTPPPPAPLGHKRAQKGDEPRKMTTFRLEPSIIKGLEGLKKSMKLNSQADVITALVKEKLSHQDCP
jgi:hypothetical protein